MNRFDRITAILIQLQSKKIIKAQDLAERFEVSLRTIYRDIRTLEEAGVPLYGEAGMGYSIVEGYRLPPVMFSKEEATAFVAAEKLMEKFSDHAIRRHFQSAMFKVKSVLRGTEKDLVQSLEDHILVKQRREQKPSVDNVLELLFKAIAETKVLEISYAGFAKEHIVNRVIEPVGVYHENEYWYTLAYCQLRNDYRNFRIDRVRDISMSEINRVSKQITLEEYQEAYAKKNQKKDVQKVIIRVEKSAVPYIQDQRCFYGYTSERDLGEMVEMTFFTPWVKQGFLRWFLMFADHAEIVEPHSLKEDLSVTIDKISEKLKAC
ncbi:Predicted DNA-binding transcriptional regulator YafY, contains an HTH and WYL domains [Zhouia amylolytica]|uniref:Predicted DNA-binding transcriptional regulator YafY, contains an HTH and WYL domains n=1 Tax=Zhouia amylolytica TaxID=376730 RepID=A0A1I6Q9I1_9FLAO|nr:YafY family protein [Zhouia amylolytica]SFS49015.1 Predicted DNA-binding transcriptional regulator YafY, contains an HTH and WYL domains [Zhouia amylolytica]